MPSSRPNTIPYVVHIIRQLRPESILDIGIGFGKWGHLFREYTDIQAAEHEPARYQRANWKVRIDGIEGYAPYITEMHRYLYNEIHLGDAEKILPGLGRYDLVFLGDVIEHFEKESGLRLLREAVGHSNKAVVVTTPRHETGQQTLCGNELETHRSLWKAGDFRQFERSILKTIDRATWLVTFLQPGITAPEFSRPAAPKSSDVRRTRQALEQLASVIPQGATFILVDEEQVRGQLPHSRAFPFLERAGEYWGPPADDAIALAELERLKASGASFIAFLWSCFWWLDHYTVFHRELRRRFPAVVDNKALVVFDLRS